MNSIAANIYDSLKENGNVHDVLKFMSLQDDKSSVVKNLAQAIKDSLKGTYYLLFMSWPHFSSPPLLSTLHARDQ